MVKLGTNRDFKLGLIHTGLDVLHAVGTAVNEALAQHFHARWLDKDADGTVTVHLLDVHTAQHIQVKNHVHAHAGDALNFALGRAVISSLIDLLIFHQFIVFNHLLEFVDGLVVIVHAMYFLSAAGTGSGRHRESHLRDVGHNVVQQGRFARTRWGTED